MTSRRIRRHAPGFTLVELVAVIVIVGALVAGAVQVFRDLRYEARVAALEGVRAAIVANLDAARTAYLVQGPGSTVTVNGRTIAVWGEDSTDDSGYRLPPGAPTPAGMFHMLGCGSTPLPAGVITACEALPGWVAMDVTGSAYLAVWESPVPENDGDFASACYVAYDPRLGHDPDAELGVWRDQGTVFARHYGVEVFTSPVDLWNGLLGICR